MIFQLKFIVFCLSLVHSLTHIKLRDILHEELLNVHYGSFFDDSKSDIDEALTQWSETQDYRSSLPFSIHFLCVPYKTIKNHRQKIADVTLVPIKYISIVTVSKKLGIGCLLIDQKISNALYDKIIVSYVFGNEPFQLVTFPFILKIGESVLFYLKNIFQKNQRDHVNHKHHSKILKNPTVDVDLIFQFSPLSSLKASTKELVLNCLNTSSGDFYFMDLSPSWKRLKEQSRIHSNLSSSSSSSCFIPDSIDVIYSDREIELRGVEALSPACLMEIIQRGAGNEAILRIFIGSKPFLMNYEARGIAQSGKVGNEPYIQAGLTGARQICGISDTGLDDLSCFFRDNTNAYASPHTDRSGEVEPLRRKVIQYFASADETDYKGGHGTHVAGTIAGDSLSDYCNYSGMAPHAKLVFFDVGLHDKLIVPSLYDVIFPKAYLAGARVHSNSWGSSYHTPYTQYSFDVDRYTYEHQDFLVVLAAGNYGEFGSQTIVPPADSKNSISVGALELRDVYTDKLLMNSTAAWFSSNGPTSDGRLKPDILAPGSVIMSAFSSPDNVQFSNTVPGSEQCATIGMSGTSMAAPVVAGLALLIRQYFMDPIFWAKLCFTDQALCKSGAFVPSGFLIKAVLLHSGETVTYYSQPSFNFRTSKLSFRLGRPADNIQGFGAVKLSNVLPIGNNEEGLAKPLQLFVWDHLNFSEHMTLMWEINFKSINKYRGKYHSPIKVTLAWYDPPSAIAIASSLLLHDLDLMVLTPDGFKLWGNGINDGDELNPCEQIHIDAPYCPYTDDAKGKDCVYRIYVLSHILPESIYQSASLVLTTSGSVFGPFISDDNFRSYGQNTLSAHENEYGMLKNPTETSKNIDSLHSTFDNTITIDIIANISINSFYLFNCLVNVKGSDTNVSLNLVKSFNLENDFINYAAAEDEDDDAVMIKHSDPNGIYEVSIKLYRIAKDRSVNIINNNNVIHSYDFKTFFRAELFIRVNDINSRYIIQHSSNQQTEYTFHVCVPINQYLYRPETNGMKNPSLDTGLGSDPVAGPMTDKVSTTNITLKGFLAGEHYTDTSIKLTHSCFVSHIYIRLEFQTFSLWSCPADLILAIISPSGGKIIIMAAPESPHWPSSWYSHENGTYKASYYVHQSYLFGSGNWTVAMRNSYSLSGIVQYDVQVRLEFSCANNQPVLKTPTVQPKSLPIHTPLPLPLPVPVQHPNYRSLHLINIPPDTSLGVVLTPKGIVKQDRIRIASINTHGILTDMELMLRFKETDPNNPDLVLPYVDGFNAVLFTIIITDPRGYVAQIGGHNWFSSGTLFYMREWPATWYAPFPKDHVFESCRDMRGADLKGNGEWTIEIASGYSSPATRCEFYGNISLIFSSDLTNTLFSKEILKDTNTSMWLQNQNHHQQSHTTTTTTTNNNNDNDNDNNDIINNVHTLFIFTNVVLLLTVYLVYCVILKLKKYI